MLFQLNIKLTKKDYFAFNVFHATETTQGKKQLLKVRALFLVTTIMLTILSFLLLGWSSFSICFALLLWLLAVPYILFYKKLAIWHLKSHINALNKQGDLPFDPAAIIEFYDDKLIEITPSTRTERNCDSIERICVVDDRYILLYISSFGAYILPIPQVREQVDYDDFLSFLCQKCATIEYYKKA